MTKSYGKIWHVYEPVKASPPQGLSKEYVKRSLIVRKMEFCEVGSYERYVIECFFTHIHSVIVTHEFLLKY